MIFIIILLQTRHKSTRSDKTFFSRPCLKLDARKLVKTEAIFIDTKAKLASVNSNSLNFLTFYSTPKACKKPLSLTTILYEATHSVRVPVTFNSSHCLCQKLYSLLLPLSDLFNFKQFSLGLLQLHYLLDCHLHLFPSCNIQQQKLLPILYLYLKKNNNLCYFSLPRTSRPISHRFLSMIIIHEQHRIPCSSSLD